MGYRNRAEFDKKRLIISSKKDFVIYGYDYEKKAYKLLGESVGKQEEIIYTGFIEDKNPSFFLQITYDSGKRQTSLKILKIKKNLNFNSVQCRFEETKDIMA